MYKGISAAILSENSQLYASSRVCLCYMPFATSLAHKKLRFTISVVETLTVINQKQSVDI